MNSLNPPFLNPGDRVGVWAPARFVTPALIAKGLKMFSDFGYDPVVPPSLYKREFQFAGKEEDRISLFNQYLIDNGIQAIVSAKGGYGSMRILPQLSGASLMTRPVWVAGFSDVTAVHAWLNHVLKIPSIHSVMLSGMDDQGDKLLSSMTLLYALSGQLKSYEISPEGELHIGLEAVQYGSDLKVPPAFTYHPGKVSARLLGGNLSLLYALASTPYDLPVGEKFILFFEDLDEYLYHIDRMMQQFKLSGKLDRVGGVLVGGMTDMHDNQIKFGKSAYDIVNEYLEPLGVPYYIGFPAGHQDLNLALYLGREVTLEIGLDGSLKLEYLTTFLI